MFRSLWLTAALSWLLATWLQAAGSWSSAQLATADRLQEPGWWPTKGTASRDEYVGTARCAECHASRAASQQTTFMARTAQRAGEAEPLRDRDLLTFRVGRYRYELSRRDGQRIYTVTDGTRVLSTPLTWAFGVGKVGQTYFFERDGQLHESRVSYFDTLQALHFTPARALAAPRDVEEAMSRPVAEPEARRCFGCHTTASTTASGFDRASAIPGITCEACHGPGRAHSEAMAAGRNDPPGKGIMNPLKLTPADSVDYCGACHASFWDVKLANEKGIAALRSQPYRLQSSRCWGEGDARITCVACHEPHRPLVRDTQSYDPRCQSCHVPAGSKPTADRPGRACPVASQNCASCHMPKYDVPEMHFQFTDHMIRRVKSTN
jgi:Cytochrome c554 and c-prime